MARVLFVGDLHLGRRPPRLPAGADAASLGPVAAWRACVDAALARHVDAVVLAGDVVESMEDRWHAFAPLEGGVRRLVDGGIAVLGVAGNHDGVALPRLAQCLSEFRLLGADGSWEDFRLEAADGFPLRIRGRSFQGRHEQEDPTRSLPPVEEGPPLVGVVHGDLDAAGSRYAPLDGRNLRNSGHPWFLGHVHKPGSLDRPPHIGYLGSICGLDPGEPGIHGPWLAEFGPSGLRAVEQISLAPLCWERGRCDLSSLEATDAELLEDQLQSLLRDTLKTILERRSYRELHFLGCRLHLCGALPMPVLARLPEVLERVRSEMPWEDRDGVTVFVEELIDETEVALDLQRLVEGGGLPGILARRLLLLQRGGTGAENLVAAFRASGPEGYDDLQDDQELFRALSRAGKRLLVGLLEQRRSPEVAETES